MAAGLSLVAGGGNRASFAQPAEGAGAARWRLPAPSGATLSELFPATARDAAEPLVRERVSLVEGDMRDWRGTGDAFDAVGLLGGGA